jgi:lipopolysaccharide/colanic/teichoic acid biosynthesis glycosyltransferase
VSQHVSQEPIFLPVQSEMADQSAERIVRAFRDLAWQHSLELQRILARPGKHMQRSVAARTAPVAAQLLRRVCESICAAVGLIILLPIFAMIALAIKLDDGGPIFYSHSRIGREHRNFRLFKFRSMMSSSTGGSTVTSPQDARVTRVGQLLRRYKLDELPQLANVLKGEMQLVGARPQMKKFVDIFSDEYDELLQSWPGITDPASLIFRNEAKFFYEGSIEEQYIKRIMPIKLEISLKYSRTRTFVSDLEILFRTVLGLPAPSAVWENTSFQSRVR